MSYQRLDPLGHFERLRCQLLSIEREKDNASEQGRPFVAIHKRMRQGNTRNQRRRLPGEIGSLVVSSHSGT